MYNRYIGLIDAGAYGDITVRKSDINGMYQLSAMVNMMGDEVRVSKVYDTYDDAETPTDFINYIESIK